MELVCKYMDKVMYLKVCAKIRRSFLRLCQKSSMHREYVTLRSGVYLYSSCTCDTLDPNGLSTLTAGWRK